MATFIVHLYVQQEETDKKIQHIYAGTRLFYLHYV